MKFACIERSAAERLRLQKVVDNAFIACRDTVGFLPRIEISPMSREELLLSGSSASAIILGWSYQLEEVTSLCATIREQFADKPLFVFLRPESISLRALRRFERFAAEVFSTEESSIRLVHSLVTRASQNRSEKKGQLIVVSGVKGGVGATSLTVGLAHAAGSVGLRSVIHDLSTCSILAHYLAAPQKHSADFRLLLTDRLAPSKHSLSRCIVTCPNGISVFLPPAGGSEIRECWLRDPDSLDISLAAFDLLCELHDLVIVDLAQTEGLLPFALLARADIRLLVTSNDPASIHLLNEKVSELSTLPPCGQTRILLNLIRERSLSESDVYSFLLQNPDFDSNSAEVDSLPHDRAASDWIGTDNSIYTEGGRMLQRRLERILQNIIGREPLPTQEITGVRKYFSWFAPKRERLLTLRPESKVPRLEIDTFTLDATEAAAKRQSIISPSEKIENLFFVNGFRQPEEPRSEPGYREGDYELSYEPPRAVGGSSG